LIKFDYDAYLPTPNKGFGQGKGRYRAAPEVGDDGSEWALLKEKAFRQGADASPPEGAYARLLETRCTDG